MNRFLLLMPIWLGLLLFLLMRSFGAKSIPKIVGVVCAGIILGGVFSFVYADMSMDTSNYIGVTFKDIQGDKSSKKAVDDDGKYAPPKKKVNTNKSNWGTDFWVEYRNSIK